MSKQREQRREHRERVSSAVYWRSGADQDLQMAWGLESSATGLAIAWRGDNPPREGTIIELYLELTAITDAPQRAVVRRVSPAHEDLVVIALELLNFSEFPPAAKVTNAFADLVVHRVRPATDHPQEQAQGQARELAGEDDDLAA